MESEEKDSSSAEEGRWKTLPEHILVSVLSYLTPYERLQAALACTAWSACLEHPLLWRRFVCKFLLPAHEKMLTPLEKHGHRIRVLEVDVDQSTTENRLNACKALNNFANNQRRTLSSLKVHFVGQNPLFYAGQEFIAELKLLFGCIEDRTEPFSYLTDLDLSGLDVAFDDSLFNILSDHQPALETLNIQNKSLVCKVTPSCIQHLVSCCRKLRDLRVFHLTLTDDVLTTMAQQENPCLRHLSVMFRRETKYTEDLSSEAWSKLVKQIPELRVTLRFDHTCPLHRICAVMKPEIPVTTLRLETFTRIFEEVIQGVVPIMGGCDTFLESRLKAAVLGVKHATTCYNKTLEMVVLHTRNSEELQRALINMAANCEKLNSLLVYCVIPENVIQQIFELRPEIKRRGNYILKSEMEEGPWLVGVETDAAYDVK